MIKKKNFFGVPNSFRLYFIQANPFYALSLSFFLFSFSTSEFLVLNPPNFFIVSD